MSKSEKRQRQKEMRRQKIEEEIRAHRAARRKRTGVNLAVLAAIVGIIAFLIVRANDDGAPTASNSPSPGATDAAEVACGGKVPENAGEEKPTFQEPPPMQIDQSKTYTATLETSCGTVVIELADDQALQTVNSFVFLANQGYFDGLTFHRVVKGFAIQGGDPAGDGTGGPGYKVTEAPPADLKYERGVVAMAKGGNEPDGTSGSQFFIVPGDGAMTLPAQYALLGKVVDGFETLQKIEEVPVGASSSGEESQPLSKIFILKVSISES